MQTSVKRAVKKKRKRHKFFNFMAKSIEVIIKFERYTA